MTIPKSVKTLPAQRARAYEILGVDPNVVAEAPKITPWLNSIKGGKTAALRYLRASDIPEARAFISRYDNILLPAFVRTHLPIEAFAIAAGLSPTRLCSVIVEAGRIYEAGQGSLRAAAYHVDIVEASSQAALDPENVEDRAMHLKHMGYLPLPKGSQVNVQVNANAQSISAAKTESLTVAAPTPEDTIRRMVNRFNETRDVPALPPPTPTESIPAVTPSRAVPAPEPVPVNFTTRAADSDYIDADYED